MSAQIRFLQGCSCGLNILTRAGFRDQMLRVVKGFSMSRHNGLFINSCFAHCQTERQDTWFVDDSPVINKKAVAIAVGSEVSRLRVPLRQELPQLGVQMS